jgi:hypothetical protein
LNKAVLAVWCGGFESQGLFCLLVALVFSHFPLFLCFVSFFPAGIALAEAWAMDVPTLVWSRITMYLPQCNAPVLPRLFSFLIACVLLFHVWLLVFLAGGERAIWNPYTGAPYISDMTGAIWETGGELEALLIKIEVLQSAFQPRFLSVSPLITPSCFVSSFSLCFFSFVDFTF